MHTRRGTEKQSHWRVRLMEKKRRVLAPGLQGSDLGFVSMIANTMSLAAHGFHASSFYGKAFKKIDSRRQCGMEHVAWKKPSVFGWGGVAVRPYRSKQTPPWQSFVPNFDDNT